MNDFFSKHYLVLVEIFVISVTAFVNSNSNIFTMI